MIERPHHSETAVGPGTRGVSEVVAFILVFAIILGSVGLLYSTAFGAMSDYQETEQQINAERAMVSLADNFNDVIRDNGVNQRSGELSLREGTISTSGGGTRLNVTINDSDPLGANDSGRFASYGDGVTADLGEFFYTSEDRRVAYEGGGVVSAGDEGDWSLVRKRPQLKCGNGTAVISLVTISSDDRSISSSSGLEFTMEVENRSSKVYDASEVTVSLDGDSAYEDAWNETLDSRGWVGEDNTPEGTCEDLERAVVTIVDVDIQY